MHRAATLLITLLLLAAFGGCSRDPNVRKQKYFDSGSKYFAEGKYKEAAIQYANAIQVDSRFAPAHSQLGETYLKLGDTTRAFQELTRAVELAPDNYRAHTDLANLLLTVRGADGLPSPEYQKQAKTHLDILRDKQPDTAETHQAWANYDAAQNNLPAALQEMQLAIAADPQRSESYLLLALLQIRSNQPDQGEISLKKAISLDPKAINLQMALGSFYQSRNRNPEAEQQFHRSIEVDPRDPAPRAALVRLLMAENRQADTEAFLKQTKMELADNSEGYRMLGDFYFATGLMDKAAAEYASLYNAHPKDPLVKRNFIQLLILKNRLDEANNLNNEILKNSPHDLDALIYKGQIQIHRGDSAGAVDTLQNALRKDPDSAVAHYQLGVAFNSQHNDARAESEWRDAVRLRPDLTDAQRALANLELKHGEIDALLQTAQQIVAAQPNAPDGYLLKAVAEENHQRYADAQQDAQHAMQVAPQIPGPYVQMGNINLVQKHFAEAAKSYRQALDQDPTSDEGLSGLMNTYFAQKKFDKAIAAANTQIAKSPNNSSFYDLLGTALFNGKKDFPAAETALRKSVELDKNNLDAIEKLGKVEIQNGSADQGLALYQQAIKDNPKEIRFYILSGELYEARQDWDNARSMYQQALAIQPEQPLAANNLAYVILQQGGNVDLALAMAQTARRGMPDSPNAADTLGWAYYQKGIYQSAIDQFQESLKLIEKHSFPDDSAVHYHLGLAYRKSNQLALARQQLEKALKISPGNADARKALSDLHS